MSFRANYPFAFSIPFSLPLPPYKSFKNVLKSKLSTLPDLSRSILQYHFFSNYFSYIKPLKYFYIGNYAHRPWFVPVSQGRLFNAWEKRNHKLRDQVATESMLSKQVDSGPIFSRGDGQEIVGELRAEIENTKGRRKKSEGTCCLLWKRF